MKRVQAVIKPERLDAVQHKLAEAGFVGIMVHDVRGHGSEDEPTGEYRGVRFAMTVKHKLLIDLLVEDDEVERVVSIIRDEAKTPGPGDGLVFVLDCAAVFPIGD